MYQGTLRDKAITTFLLGTVVILGGLLVVIVINEYFFKDSFDPIEEIEKITKLDEPEPEQDQVLLPTTIEILSNPNVTDGWIDKKFTHGDTEILYTVGVENGIEETPLPSVLQAMRDSYSEEEKKIIDQNTKDLMFKRFGEYEQVYHMTQVHLNHKLKKEFIDSNFTCETYKDLAKRFDGEMLLYVGFAGSAEEYIFGRAINECIDPKLQEKIDKVYEELEEVNKPN